MLSDQNNTQAKMTGFAVIQSANIQQFALF
jgi:hypothetical protein